ncbi:hypothetical protein PR202_ga11180 [Eleusine coracana subsp. coracana]|uniref:Uncharacterized protein n=1 Tax=Eleusine coracana subsp. coracana TaxID=191504 RepID=A0AAV5C8P6_ELECO|nr:hypothetical protein PR202_ga11180 [Eleusine coracana subsp. coracana]
MSESTRAFELIAPSSSSAADARGEKKAKVAGVTAGGSVAFHRLFAFADGADAALMSLGALGAVANGAALPLMTVLFGRLIDAFGGAAAPGDVLRRVSAVSLDFVYLAVASAAASFIQVTCWMITGERQAARIRALYLKTILRQEVGFFDQHHTCTGEVVGRMAGDTVLIQDAMGEKVGKFIQLLVTFLGGFGVAFAAGWLLALVMLATIPPLVLAGAVMASVVARMASLGQAAYADAAGVVEQTVGSIRTVASFTGEKQAVDKYGRSLKSAYSSGVREGLAAGVGMGTVMVLLFCGYSLGIWYGAKLILEKGYTGAQVMNVIFAVLTGSLALGQASPSMKAFAGGQAAAYKMFETINREPEIDAYSTTGRKLDDIQGNIEFREVHFSYPARPDEQIFRGFSLAIQSGTTVALVGQSGSGKSTVISLIERFYDPQLGEILIDGVDLKEFQLRWIRSKIGLVSQEPVLFAASIRENIAYGKENATDEEIRAAAELANASKFIDKMPQGFATLVGEHGTQLSGGQKQRIAIARAILKDPRILLLDEATSALDTESERIVQEALDRVMINRTTVIVAHRLSTVRNADTIAVIHRGSVVEKGPHFELLRDPEGAYSQLIRLQEASRDTESANYQSKARRKGDSGVSIGKQLSINLPPSQRSPQNNNRNRSFSVSFNVPLESDANDRSSHKVHEEIEQEVPLSRLASLNKPEIPVLILGSIASAVSGVIFPIFAILLSNVIKAFYEPPHILRKEAEFWSSMFLVVGVVYFLSLPLGSYLFSVAGCKLIRRIRLMAFEKVVNMEIEWFDYPENSSGAIGARLSADAAKVRGLVGDALQLAVQNFTTLVAGLVIAFVSNWQLSLIILALIPLIGLNGWIQMKFIQGFSADAKLMYEEASQVANDAVSSIRTVASFSAEEKVMDLYKKKCEEPLRAGIRTGIISGIGFGVSFFLLFGVYAASFYAGARLVAEEKTTFPKVFMVFLALTMAAIGVSHTSTLTSDSSKAKSAVSSIFAIVDRESRINPSDDSGVSLEPLSVALVGESGSGKSTAIALLQRFYDPDAGHILLDGVDIYKFQLRWLRQQMGLVSQEPSLFNDTIRANIAYGKEGEATESDVVAAARLANAHKFISSLHQGYDTMVGERGAQLSGGQKQRVAIARAIVKDPKILLLDEATSALDAESERTVQDALERVMVNRTTVIVAHRLSTIQGADMIAVVKNGRIVEKGRHDTLIGIDGGAYASLLALHSSASTS